ncbi:MAG: hypothetical protein LC722_05820 [Actinobacteria bacterium]|nr:hypothetical protein [Actinomycetota bacterium]
MRRRRLAPELEEVRGAFDRAVGPVEEAKEAAVSAMPTARLPGRPLADALMGFEDALEEARSRMPGWRHQALEEEWSRCSDALAEALRMAERLRLEAPHLGFDAMAFALQDLIAPLEAFEEAALRFRSLRR